MSNINENNAVIETFEEAIPVEVPEEPKVETKKVFIGKIRDCDKLNVRVEPNVKSKVLCKLDSDSEVLVEKSKSTEEFYKITTSSGVDGYCMKKYLSVKKQEV